MIIRRQVYDQTGDQMFACARRSTSEIRALFEREGIRFAHREVTLRLADWKGCRTLAMRNAMR